MNTTMLSCGRLHSGRRLASQWEATRLVLLLGWFPIFSVATLHCGASKAACTSPPSDVTANGSTNAADVQCALLVVMHGLHTPTSPPPACIGTSGNANTNCSGGVDISDVLVTIYEILDIDLGGENDLDGDGCIDTCESESCSTATSASCDDGHPSTFDTCLDGVGCLLVSEGSTCAPGQAGVCSGRGSCARLTSARVYGCNCDAGYAGTQCERCDQGFHPVSAQGELGAASWPTHDAADADALGAAPNPKFTCEPDKVCPTNFCGQHGECVSDRGSPECRCERGRSGPRCAECDPLYDLDSLGQCVLASTCRQRRCGERGACIHGPTAIECVCDVGFAGPRCSACAAGYHDDGDTCALDPVCGPDSCSGHGTCSVEDNSLRCVCDAGYAGETCEHTCAGEACSGSGTCVLSSAGALCNCTDPDLLPTAGCGSCATGLTLVALSGGGSACALPTTCSLDLCGEHGTCIPSATGGEVSCVCAPQYAGRTCRRCAAGHYLLSDGTCANATQCRAAVCNGAGECTAASFDAAPACVCDPGRRGNACEEERPIAAYEVSGHAGVLEFGQSTNLSAKALGVGELAELEWTLLEGPGVLLPTGPGTATFVAPSSAPGPLGITKIGLAPIGCPGQGVELGLHYSAPPMPWVTGPAVAAFASVDSRLMQFMYDRCTGGAVVAVNWKGVPIIRRGYGRDRGRSTPGRPAVSCGPADPEALPVWPDSPVRVGSNSKALSAAMLRKTVESRLLAYGRRPDPDDYDTDAAFRAAVDQAVENVRILDAQLNLLPIGMRMHLGSCTFTGSSPLDNQYTCSNGGTPPPVVVPITGNGAPANCSGNPCFNGGNCAINPQGNAVCACPQGFTGGRCRQLTGGSNLAPNGVDRRWQNITVGHLLTHTSGLPNGIESQDLALANIEALRGRHDPAFSIPEDIGPFLHDYSPSLQEPGPGEPDSYFLEDRPSTFEFIWLQAGRNLDYAPGAVSVYSNLGFILIGAILDYTSAQLGWAAGDTWGGAPDSHLDHAGSRVDGFVRVYLGGRPGDTNPWGATRSRYGMFLARSPDPSAAPFSQTDPFELQPRDWVNGVLNPPQEDRKGNVCEYSAQTGCTWKSGIIDYFGNPGLVPYGLNGNLISAAAGGLVTEAHLYLRFMAAFTVGYSSTFPGYGRPRVGWQQASSHNGEWVGAKAHARQVGWRTNGASCTHRKVLCNPGDPLATCCPQGGTCCAANFDCVTGGRPSFPVNAVDTSQNECVSLQTYVIPTVNNTTGDYSPKANTNTTGGCVLPEGLDIFVASNQTSDAQDVDGTDYDYLQDAVIRGLCEVNWPLNPWLIAPGNHKLPAFSP